MQYMDIKPKIFPTEYYSNGNRKQAQTVELVDGDIHSIISNWHENGTLVMESVNIYLDGKYYQVSLFEWNEEGKEIYLESYPNPFNLNYELEDTIKYSKSTSYLSNGHRREVNFKHIFTDRDIEGIGDFPAAEKIFHHGKSCEWNSEGQIISERNYLNGKADGVSMTWHSNSQMSWKIYMKNGQFHGKSISWHTNGQKKDEGIYINNNKDGKWTSWDLNGQVIIQENYKDGGLVK